jgi:hypothetical protein
MRENLKRFFIGLFFLFVFLQTDIVFSAESEFSYNGVLGTLSTVDTQKGKILGKCEGKNVNDSCEATGAINPKCLKQGAKGELSCTAKECKSSYLLHVGYGICRTKKGAEDFCKKHVSCKSGEIAVPVVTDNPNSGKSGQTFKDCFCTGIFNVEYSCGKGEGTAPSDTTRYTSIDEITAKQNSCTKNNSVFTGWKCGKDNVDAGGKFSIKKNTTCVAQWNSCAACKPGAGCTCSLSVENNQCKYTTGLESGYLYVSGENTATPKCEIGDEKKCTDSGGEWAGGVCKCKPDIEGAKWNIKNKKCECDEPGQIIENNKCIVPEKCPDGASKKNGKCECDEPGQIIEGDKCIIPEKCPDGASKKNGKCECDEPGQIIEGDKCIVPEKCPDGASKKNGKCECDNPGYEIVTEKTDGKEVLICKEKESKKAPKEKKCENSGEQLVNGKCVCPEGKRLDKEAKECIDDLLDEKIKNYEDKKANEQSTANKTLTALTTAATGIGGMELAMGLSQQKADKEADANMEAYLQTFRCSYGEGKQVKAGPEEIELPGGNIPELMKLRNEYVALAADLKERKTALGMKPGIESEEILDKATMGLYDDENIGITGGAYASLYRAKMLGSEEDQAKIDSERKASKNRVIAGGVLVGVGVVGGIVGNALINSKKKNSEKETSKSANKKDFNEWAKTHEIANKKSETFLQCIEQNMTDKDTPESVTKKCEDKK